MSKVRDEYYIEYGKFNGLNPVTHNYVIELENDNENLTSANKESFKIIQRLDKKLLESKTQWISVKDRLPNDKKDYLICCNGGVVIARYKEKAWQDSAWFYKETTHWMPLPDKPE